MHFYFKPWLTFIILHSLPRSVAAFEGSDVLLNSTSQRVGENEQFNFQSGHYQYSGSVNTGQTLLDFNLVKILHYTLDLTIRRKPPSTRVTPGRSVTWYDEGTKITLLWVMLGGKPFTYGECVDAVELLITFLDAHVKLNQHTMQASISVDALVKIKVVVELVSSEEVEIGEESGLRIKGHFYNVNSLSPAGIKSVITKLAREDASHVATELVPEGTYQKASSYYVQGFLVLNNPDGGIFPQITWDELKILMEQLSEFFIGRDKWGPLSGGLRKTWPDDAGFFYIEGWQELEEATNT